MGLDTMIQRTGDMWTDATGEFKVLLASTCCQFKIDADLNFLLIMGKGSAGALAERYPFAPKLFADQVTGRIITDYGFMWYPSWSFGAFQTKRDFRNSAVIEVIQLSTGGLLSAALMYPSFTFHLPYPGVGYGMLSPMVVEPIIKVLPDNVHVWQYGDKL